MIEAKQDGRRRGGNITILAKSDISGGGYVLLCTCIVGALNYKYSIEHNSGGHIEFYNYETPEEAGAHFIKLIESDLKKSVLSLLK